MPSTDLLAPSSSYAVKGTATSRLIVTRRDAADRTYRAVGYLDRLVHDGTTTYEFTYLAAVTERAGFVPIVGFRDLHRTYSSERLFPSFAERVMSAKRPDRPQYLESLDLAVDADAWEILAASGGHREGDPIELISLPEYDQATGATKAHFLAHGARYRSGEASNFITSLSPGDQLILRPEPTNPVDPNAIQIVGGGLHLGFVPSPLSGYARSVLDAGDCSLTVVRANPPETHPHLRLLLALEGRSDEFVFDCEEWRAASGRA